MELAQEMSAVAVRLPSGATAMAEPRPDLGEPLRLWSAWDGEAKASRFYRIEASPEGWPVVCDVTSDVAPALAAAVRASQKKSRALATASRRRTRDGEWTPPEAWQEQHSPTEDVKVRYRQDGAKRVDLIQCRRRVLEARLWNGIHPSLQDAAVAIERGFSLVTRGMGHKPPSYELGAGGKGGYTDRDTGMIEDYWAWGKEALRQRIDHAAIILVLVEGMSLAAVDAARRKRKGYARAELMEGLNLFCRLRGWPTQKIAA
jgi:hypothetical protein